MYNYQDIIAGLQGLVGFEQSYRPEDPVLAGDLITSSSGLNIGPSQHPLLSFDNILAIGQRFYDSTEILSTAYNDFLQKKYDQSVTKLMASVFQNKKLAEASKTLLSEVRLFEGVGNLAERLTKTGRFVGYKLTLKEYDTIAALSHIGLQLDTAQNINIYLYHTDSDVPIATFAVNHTKSVVFEWHIVSTILSTLTSAMVDGSFRLGYYESDLVGNAIKKDISFSGLTSCGSCHDAVRNKSLHSRWSKYVDIQPFYVNAGDLNLGTRKLWDVDQELYLDNNTFGMNIQMTVQCDVTRVLLQNKQILAQALAQQITVDLLTEMTFSLRDNQLKQKVAGLAAVALDNQENGQYGEAKKLREAIKALSFDLSDMSSLCMGCNTVRTKLKSVWT